MTKLFPITLMLLDLCAALVYFWSGDIKRGVYLVAAAILSWMVIII